MKIIISHDVDHLYTSDHYFKDLIVEKFLVRSLIDFLKRKISLHTLLHRTGILFTNRMNNLDALMKFDRAHCIPSTFFFGMSNGLGMSYSKKQAVPFIRDVKAHGFDVGVHGIEYRLGGGIKAEHDSFKRIVESNSFGIRNHYVRFDNETFSKMDRAGYLFDSTQFNKETVELVNPYKIGNMWEFPLHVMDEYVCKTGDYRKDFKDTCRILEEAEKKGIRYFTILFHDDAFNYDIYPEEYQWYVNLIRYFEDKRYEFISYRDAIEELESGKGQKQES